MYEVNDFVEVSKEQFYNFVMTAKFDIKTRITNSTWPYTIEFYQWPNNVVVGKKVGHCRVKNSGIEEMRYYLKPEYRGYAK